jgi:hypothetical protein
LFHFPQFAVTQCPPDHRFLQHDKEQVRMHNWFGYYLPISL